jgi:TonB family protein
MAQVRHNADFCWIEAPPGDAPGPRAVSTIDLEGHTVLRLSGKDWAFAPDTVYTIRARPLDIPAGYAVPDQQAEGRGFRDASGWAGIELPSKGSFFGFSHLALYREAEAQPFAEIDTSPSWEPLRACLTEIAGNDRGSGNPAAADTGPKLRFSFVNNDDYPAAALTAKQQGLTIFQLTVSAHGIPSRCAIAQSSGSALLDSTACALAMRRARYRPARDAGGQPTQGVDTRRFTWALPAD